MQHGVALTLTGTSVAFTLKHIINSVSKLLNIIHRATLIDKSRKYKTIVGFIYSYIGLNLL